MSSTLQGPGQEGAEQSPRIVTVVGNPRPGSRTAALARGLADAIATVADPAADPALTPVTLDLADLLTELGPPLGADSAQRYAEPLRLLHAARLLVIATPTYKGSYTGLLKSFLDHVGGGALHGITAVPVLSIGSPAHALAADVHLRPLLVELGASTPTSALIAGPQELDAPGDLISDWIELNRQFVVPALVPAETAVPTARQTPAGATA